MKKTVTHLILIATIILINIPLKSQTSSNVCFAPSINYLTGAGAGPICAADINGDGNTDLVVSNLSAHSLSVLLGSNTGSFTVNQTMFNGFADICKGDFNNDNIDDIAGVSGLDSIVVLLGTNSGVFSLGGKYKAGNYGYGCIRSADFNNDNYEDLIVVSNSSGVVSVLLGTNTGAFTFLQTSAMLAEPTSNICIVDFNNDGNLDLGMTVNNWTYVGKFFGNGNGYFPITGSVLGTNTLNDIYASDFNNDGIVDVAGASGNNVLMALGSYSFTNTYYAGFGCTPASICSADFNGDGYLDLATANGGCNNFSTMLNTGSGTFHPSTNLAVVGYVRDICSGDFNNDGRPDVAVSNFNHVSVFLNSPLTLTAIPPNIDTICQGTNITLTANAIGTYTWIAGVNTPSCIVSPTVTTTYSIVSSNLCLTDTAYNTIFVKPRPIITTNTGTVCPGQSFTIIANGAATYTYSSGSNVVYPSGVSNYTISGTSLNGCSSSIVSTIYALLPNITVNDGYVCIGQSYTIMPSGAFTYTYSSGTNIVTPSVTTQYTVAGTDLNGCTDSRIINIGVVPLPQLNTSSGGIICSGGVTTLSANVLGIITPNPCIPSSPTAGTASGDYINSVNLSSMTNTTGASTSPYCNLYPQTTTLTIGNTYSLTIGAGNYPHDDYAAWIDYNKNGKLDDYGEKIGEMDNVGVSFPSTITFTFTVPSSAYNGTARIRIMVTDHSTFNNMNPCAYLSSYGETEDYNIFIQGGQDYTAYSWVPIGNLNSSIVQNPISNASVTTIYTVTVVQPGCVLTDTISVFTNLTQAPVVTVNNGTICSGNNFTLNPTGAITYTYINGGPVVLPDTTESYTVLGEDSNGCISSATSSLIVNPSPIINVSGITNICLYSSVELIANGANTYIWNTGATTPSIAVTPTTTTIYSVTGIDLNNCVNFETVSITVDPTCQDVWPGDVNSDGFADNLDVLELGLHYTQTGSPRASTSNNWQSYFANNWSGTITNGQNLNHSDCNGNGTINDDDTLAIYNNYGLTHAFKPAQTNTVITQLSIVPDQSFVTKGNWGTASVYLGDAINQINNINGLAFTVDFDNDLIETNNIYIEYQNSFLDAGQNLDFRKLDFASGKIYTATTHTVNNNVSGFGKIATLHYQILTSLATDQVLNIGLIQANQSDASGLVAPLTTGTETLMAIGASVGLVESLNNNLIYISPNPTNGLLTINSNGELQKIEVISITGQVLLSEIPSANNHVLHLENFANGIYFVNMYQNNRIIKREKVVLNK